MVLIKASLAISIAFALPLASANAQAPAGISVGMQVTDVNGGIVGTVTGLQGENLMIRTDRHDALLPKTSFTPAEGKLLFGMTAAELNAEIDKSLAAADAAVVAGATVKGTAGTAVGTLDAVDAETATIKLASGKSIRVPRSGIRGDADGSVLIGLTAEQLEAQVEAAGADAKAESEPAGVK